MLNLTLNFLSPLELGDVSTISRQINQDMLFKISTLFIASDIFCLTKVDLLSISSVKLIEVSFLNQESVLQYSKASELSFHNSYHCVVMGYLRKINQFIISHFNHD